MVGGVAILVLVAVVVPADLVYFLFTPMLPPLIVASRGRIQSAHARAFATGYLVTDLRIIFVAQWPAGAEYRWMWLHRLPPARVEADERGVGTITFGTSFRTRWTLASKPNSGAWAPFVPDLHAVADAPRVAELIRQAQSTPLPR
ncbi:hypothetical protein [Amycolatopsis sp. NPDC051371]|uniref:hypothetical protein n=1 Tax=Amycolatopsis sp. NPDC051371 TaxID=3155800 RepID=UPI0034451179